MFEYEEIEEKNQELFDAEYEELEDEIEDLYS